MLIHYGLLVVNELNTLKTTNSHCINGYGSYRCECMTGYRKDNASGECVDIDECATQNYVCNNSTYCSNRNGSYECCEQSDDETLSNKCYECGYQYFQPILNMTAAAAAANDSNKSGDEMNSMTLKGARIVGGIEAARNSWVGLIEHI